jgi:2-methylcitrate dehydratase PrpD
VQLAGSTLPWSKAVYRYVRSQGGVPECAIVNHSLRTSPVNAALANGTFGHSFEMDDNHARSSIKGGCAIVPAALATGERQLSSGRELILAAVAAYEVMTRIGLSVTPVLMQRGFQPTATCGPFGAAIAAGKLLNFDERTMLHAISIAASHGSGLMEAPAGGRGELKRFYGGMAASNGLRSALLAKEGLTGPESMLEGEQGFCHAFGDSSNMEALTAGLGEEWEILSAHYKIYAQDGYIQPMTEALERIVKRHRFDVEAIEEVRAGCCRFAHEDVVGVIREPKDLTSAQYSANFSLALFLVKGGAGFRGRKPRRSQDCRVEQEDTHRGRRRGRARMAEIKAARRPCNGAPDLGGDLHRVCADAASVDPRGCRCKVQAARDGRGARRASRPADGGRPSSGYAS